MRVLVVGAGISGLAAARGLAAAGHEVVVLEQAQGLRLGGGAVTLWCNGTAILGDLGVDLEGTGQRLTTMCLRTASGRQVLEFDLEALAERFGSAARVIPRGSLINLLESGLPEGTVRFGTRVAELRTDGDGVRVRTETGQEYGGDFLVGADGVHSRVRALVLGGGPAALTGGAIWQGLTPAPFDPGSTTTLMVGRQGDFGYMGAGDGLMQWFFDVPWSPGAPPEDKPLEMLRRRFTGWGAPVEQVLASLGDGDAELFPHTRHKVPRHWGDGRCVLLGDAAHGMPPVGAQGTNQALEDVATLVECLDAVPDPAAVVGVYSSRRRRQAALASMIASHSLAVSGPRTLMQSEYLMRMNASVPPRLATRGFGGLLRTLSNRI
ncbi:FAD-dependent oxidoreductase [Nonomuraea africana]|uniref:FAD-dependent urate hydroxylase n=1 Tax=Nonomuraea africana TaxID=46171 RepID=A0ABR9KJF6_9ACTN|nr:NAD(P)/FAD-dependent oxidoreductase [Nonomuraea africana]MBE1561911.1 FAD-dependent urate hydroxylase [Nonomuraea africana]